MEKVITKKKWTSTGGVVAQTQPPIPTPTTREARYKNTARQALMSAWQDLLASSVQKTDQTAGNGRTQRRVPPLPHDFDPAFLPRTAAGFSPI